MEQNKPDKERGLESSGYDVYLPRQPGNLAERKCMLVPSESAVHTAAMLPRITAVLLKLLATVGFT